MDILLYSSGVDSYIAYYYLQQEKQIDALPVYIDLGHRYANIEKQFIRKARPNTVIIPLKDYGMFEKHDAYIPLRNLLFCIVASSYFIDSADSLNIYLGGLRDDRIRDNNPDAFRLYSKVLSHSTEKEVQVKSAFDFKLSKAEIVEWFSDHYPDTKEDLISNTFSCYHPNSTKKDPHCYNCRACFRRNVALQTIQILPFDRLLLSKYFSELIKNKYEYDPKRYEMTLKYCERILGIRSV